MIHWVFCGRRGHSVREDDLGPQLDLGFAFTGPLEIAVVPETKRTSSAPAGSSVQGAPLGSAAIEKGCPPGQHAEAAPRPAPGTDCSAAAPKAAAKRAPRAAAKTRRISIPPGVKVGCGKCKHDEVGCTTCRPKAGLVESDKKGVWILKPAV